MNCPKTFDVHRGQRFLFEFNDCCVNRCVSMIRLLLCFLKFHITSFCVDNKEQTKVLITIMIFIFKQTSCLFRNIAAIFDLELNFSVNLALYYKMQLMRIFLRPL